MYSDSLVVLVKERTAGLFTLLQIRASSQLKAENDSCFVRRTLGGLVKGRRLWIWGSSFVWQGDESIKKAFRVKLKTK